MHKEETNRKQGVLMSHARDSRFRYFLYEMFYWETDAIPGDSG